MLAASHRAHYEQRLVAHGDRIGKRSVGRVMGQILLAGEEPYEGPPFERNLIANRTAQHGIAGLECVEDGALRDLTLDVDRDFTIGDTRERPQVRGKDDSNHVIVCTSTDTTAGRSRTMGVQLSPASAEP